MGLKKIIPSWLSFVARRLAHVDRAGRSALTGALSTLGIVFGVMTLIVVMAVMNGFQAGSIQSVLEISSYHIRVSPDSTKEVKKNLITDLKKSSLVSSVTPFIEAQSLIIGFGGRQAVSLLRFVPEDVLKTDKGLSSQVHMISGSFLNKQDSIVLGYTLAQSLGVGTGDTINLLAVSGGADVDLFAQDRLVTVSGIFSCSFAEINNSFAFLRLSDVSQLLGDSLQPLYGIKLKNSNNAERYIAEMEAQVANLSFESWQSYNRSFFGALRVEKNILMILVFLIFIVVAINIFNSMRRMVYERRNEISVLAALGSTKKNIQQIFLIQGFKIGFGGAISGLLLGLLLSVRMDAVFTSVAHISYGIQYFFTMLINPTQAKLLSENSMFSFYSQIPAQPRFAETAFITLFGVLSSVTASRFASRHTLKLSVAEVLHDE